MWCRQWKQIRPEANLACPKSTVKSTHASWDRSKVVPHIFQDCTHFFFFSAHLFFTHHLAYFQYKICHPPPSVDFLMVLPVTIRSYSRVTNWNKMWPSTYIFSCPRLDLFFFKYGWPVGLLLECSDQPVADSVHLHSQYA